MLFRWLADALVTVHAAFVLFVVAGGVAVIRWQHLAWLHAPAAAWGALVEFSGWVCPLTPLENAWRARAGEAGYSGGFVEHYVLRALYPAGLTRANQLVLGACVLIVNAAAYALVYRRWHPRPSRFICSVLIRIGRLLSRPQRARGLSLALRSLDSRAGSTMTRASAPRIPDAAWSPLASGVSMLAIGLVGLASGTLLLFPSLGPSAVMQAHSPSEPNAKPYRVVVGHLGGMASAYLAVAIFGLATAPSVFEMHHLSLARVGASVLGVSLAMLLEIVLHSTHPPAASTTLLIALGSFKLTAHDAATVIAGVLAVTVVGEALRQWRLAQTREAPLGVPTRSPAAAADASRSPATGG